MVDQSGPNAMALEMARWLIGWGRSYPAEWDGMSDVFQCLWNISRYQYTDNRTNGILPITMAALTLARDTADETHPSATRLNKHVCHFYSPPGTVPKPMKELLGEWPHSRLEQWLTVTSQSVPVARRFRRGAQLTNAWGVEFMFATLVAYLEDVHLLGRASLARRNRQVEAISTSMMALASQDPGDLESARRCLEFESP